MFWIIVLRNVRRRSRRRSRHIQDRISYRNLVNDRRYSPEDVLQEPEELTNEEPEEEQEKEDLQEDDD